MDSSRYSAKSPGRLIECRTPQGEDYLALLPELRFPDIQYEPALVKRIARAELGLGRLHHLGQTVPSADLVAYAYLRKEAELSSRIEGTRTTLGELFLFEAGGSDESVAPDAREVFNYVRTLNYGLDHPVTGLSLFGIRELHQILLEGVRGEDFHPGRCRTSQVYIANHRMPLREAPYVPPPPEQVLSLLEDWARMLHEPCDHPELVRIAVSHYQFEAIHPFEDGNGRIGRLLIMLLLCERGLLAKPLLYLSAYFEKHHEQYYQGLRDVSERGAWMEWLAFFMDAVIEQSEEAVSKSEKILRLREQYQERIRAKKPKARAALLDFLDWVFRSPYLTSSHAVRVSGLSLQVASAYLKVLESIGIVEEITGRFHHRVYRATELLELLQA